MSGRPSRHPLLWIALGALVVRIAALLATADIPCLLDECSYRMLAETWAAGGGFVAVNGHLWPPGYPAFLAAHLLAGGTPLAAKGTQVLLSTLLVPLVFLLARRAARGRDEPVARRVGLIAAALIAFDPTLIAFSHYLWPETLFLPLFVVGLLAVLEVADRLDRGRPALDMAVLAGIAFGLACLVKVLPLYLVLLLAAWLVLRGSRPFGRAGQAAAVLVGVTFAVILPWTARHAFVYQRFALIETTTGKNLVRGNNAAGPSDWDWGDFRRTPALRDADCRDENPVDLDRCLTRHALRTITADPGRFIADLDTKVADLLNPTSFLVRHVRAGVYGAWPPGLADLLVLSVAVFNMGLMGLAVIGWRHGPASSARAVGATVTTYVVAVHLVTFGMSRFRLPLAPLLAVGAGLALASSLSWRDMARGRRALVPTLALLAILLACWWGRAGHLFHEPTPDEPRPVPGLLPGDAT